MPVNSYEIQGQGQMRNLAFAIAVMIFPAISYAGEMGADINISYLGYGVELIKNFSDDYAGRVGFNAWNRDYGMRSGQVNYDLNHNLQSVTALADWYPFRGGFRASGGLFYNRYNITLNAQPSGGALVINGTPYIANAAYVSSLRGSVAYNTFAPYVGIGWGSPLAKNKGWGLVSDFGVVYFGVPKVNLNATCGPSLSAAGGCASLNANVAADKNILQNTVNHYIFFPVISLGVSYTW